ncbi:MAG: hypothetical protein V3S56_06140 [Gemmatimonadota bacterium]
MDMKRLMTGTIVGGILLFGLGYLFYEVLLAEFFGANAGSATGVWRETPIFWALLVGELMMAALVTMALDKTGATSTAAGAKVGAILGFMVWFSVDFIHYGLTNLSNLTATIADPVVEIVRVGIVGAVIAMVLAKTAGSSSTDY